MKKQPENNDCSCRGVNPNCFKCEGTGILKKKNSPGKSHKKRNNKSIIKLN